MKKIENSTKLFQTYRNLQIFDKDLTKLDEIFMRILVTKVNETRQFSIFFLQN